MRRSATSGGMLCGLFICSSLWSADGRRADQTESEVAERTAASDVAAEVPPLDTSDFLFRDWGGWRSEMAAAGVTFDIQWTQHAAGVVDGGVERTFRYGGALDYAVQLDLGAMDLMPGGFVKVRAESRYGESVNGDAGALLPANSDLSFPLTSTVDDNIAITITELSYTQFLAPTFGVVLGKFQTLDGDPNEFASGRGRSQLSNASFIFNPVTALTVPYSTLGVGVVWIPSPQITVSSLVYNTTDASTTTGFGDFGDGSQPARREERCAAGS